MTLDLLLTLLACALWYVWPALGPWPLLLIAAGRLVRTLTSGRLAWRRTPFDLPLLLFLLSAAAGMWLAYDQAVGQAKFWVIVGGLALYDSLARGPEEVRILGRAVAPQRLLFALLPAVIACYFLLTNDWSRWMGKLPWLDPLMRWLAAWQPHLPGHRLHPNVAGGLIAALIPLQIAAVGSRRIAWPLVALAALGLLLTGSRGAWIALGVVAAGWTFWHGWGWRWSRRTWLALASLLLVVGIAAAAIALEIGPALFPGSRLELWRNAIDLALDTPLTGLGLGGFQMAYSSYVLLLHVGHTIHAHNLLLNIWIEQGLPGLVIFLWLLVVAAEQRAGDREQESVRDRVRSLAPLAALGVILAHGMVDDAFYGSRGVLLLFVPFALLARTSPPAPLLRGEGSLGGMQDSPSPGRACPELVKGRGGWRVRLFAAVLLLGLALFPGTRAMFQANLGALLQTRAELSIYRWPAWPIQDAVRRQTPGSPPPVDLTPAIVRYQAALALDPGNAAANRRLGQIELSLGDYDAARDHLEAAYAAVPEQRATRQLLGESYAIAGEIGQAAALWRTVDVSQGQLPLREWWYGAIGEPENQQRIGQAIRRLTGDR